MLDRENTADSYLVVVQLVPDSGFPEGRDAFAQRPFFALSRLVSVSPEASSSRNGFTSADTYASRWAAVMRARRQVSSCSETLIFFIRSQNTEQYSIGKPSNERG